MTAARRGGRRTGASEGAPAGDGPEPKRRLGRRSSRTDAPAGDGPKPSRKPKRRQGCLHNLVLLVQIVVLVIVIRTFLVATFVITSGSMEKTLLEGDFLIVNRAALGPRVPFTDWRLPGYSEPRRGNVLVFDPPHEEDLTVVKRLVGMPGDTLEMRDRALYLNGEAMEEPYAVHAGEADVYSADMRWQLRHLLGGPRADYRPTRDNWGPIVVPEGRYFMLGDNRDSSLDSRFWGFLERWRLEGRAVAIYYSFDRQSPRFLPWITEVRANRIGNRIR